MRACLHPAGGARLARREQAREGPVQFARALLVRAVLHELLVSANQAPLWRAMPSRRAAWSSRMLSGRRATSACGRCCAALFASLRFASPFVSLRLLRASGVELLARYATPAVTACTNCAAGARSGARNPGRRVDTSCRLSRAERRTARSPPWSRALTARCAHTRRVCGSYASLLLSTLAFHHFLRSG